MTPEDRRRASLKIAQLLGYPLATHLPPAEDLLEPRPVPEIADRFLALSAVVSSAFGLDDAKSESWLEKEGLWGSLTDKERHFVIHGGKDLQTFQIRLEALWALGWVLGLVNELDFNEHARDRFDAYVPDVGDDEARARLRPMLRPRSFDEVAAASDLACCLHWGRDEALRIDAVGAGVSGYVIFERQRALEWVLSDKDWDAISLDT